MKKYVLYLLGAAYFGALFANILNQIVDPHWLALVLGFVASLALGAFVARVVIIEEKYKRLETRFNTADYLRQIDERGELANQIHIKETLARLANKFDYLDQQLAKLVQPSEKQANV